MKIAVALSSILLMGKVKYSFASFQAFVTCKIVIGERDDRDDTRHRRLVRNELPQSCDSSDNIVIYISHDNVERSFQRHMSTSLEDNQINGISHGYWYGEDHSDGSTFNYIQDELGNIHASMTDVTDGLVMQFQVDHGGESVVTITNSSSFPDEITADAQKDQYFHFNRSAGLNYDVRSSDTPIVPVDPIDSNNNGDILDVMVAYTVDAECRNANLPKQCSTTPGTAASIKGMINLAIAETNTAFKMSGAMTKLRLVHTFQITDYVEDDFSGSLRSATFGDIQGLHEKREFYKADLVALIIDNPQYCGIAYIGPNPKIMYSVTAWNCATGYFSFGHEIGHNLGLKHDRGTEGECDSESYNYGYRDPEGRFRSILAYSCQRGQCDNNLGKGRCTRVQRFSNDEFDYMGDPIGSPVENNVRKINAVRSEVATYFISPSTSTTPTKIMPTAFPTFSPTTKSPTLLPTAFPTEISATRPSCEDSPFDFQIKFDKVKTIVDCKWVSYFQETRCLIKNIATICPATCNFCFQCIDSKLKFNIDKKFRKVKCKDLVKNNGLSCDTDGIGETCRFSCERC